MLSRLLNMNKMAEALSQRQVGKGEFYCYAGLYILGTILVFYFYINGEFAETVYEPAFLKNIEIAIVALGTILSIAITYHANKSGDNSDFWYRFFSMNFAIGIFILLISIPIIFILYITGILTDSISYPDILLEIVFLVLSLYLIHKYIKQIALRNTNEHANNV